MRPQKPFIYHDPMFGWSVRPGMNLAHTMLAYNHARVLENSEPWRTWRMQALVRGINLHFASRGESWRAVG